MASYRGLWLAFGWALASVDAGAVATVSRATTPDASVREAGEAATVACDFADCLVADTPMPDAARALADLRGRFAGETTDYALGEGLRHAAYLLRLRRAEALQVQVQALPAEPALAVVVGSTGTSTPSLAPVSSPGAGPGGRVYVTNERSGELTVLDPLTRTVRATIPLGRRARGLALSPDGRHLYVALSGAPVDRHDAARPHTAALARQADGVGVVDAVKLRLVGTLSGVSAPKQLVVSRDGRKLYVASEDTGTAVVLDAATGKTLAVFTVGREPEGVGISHDGRWVYVSSEIDDEVTVIDTQVDAAVATIPTCARPRAIVFARSSPRAYVSCEDAAKVALFDVQRHREIRRLRVPGLGARPMGVALSPDEQTLYVATGRGGTLVAMATQDRHRVRASVAVGQRPWGISVSADGRRIYTANGPSNDVSIVDAASMKVLERVAVGGGPWDTLVQDDLPVPTTERPSPSVAWSGTR
ncbi:MAG TPA: cytochrome D1 domain-containing protein [Steroidobacteraceae bacterium]|nr:cytochrome D1 domain-containing protein [Steroidobacteraceae bacterium]